MAARDAIETLFTRWGRFVLRRRWAVLALTVAATAGLATFLPGLRVDNATEAFLLPDDPARIRYDEFRARFDRDDKILVMLHPPEVFDLGFLETLRRFHEDVEREVPYVDEVTSLVNARNTYGKDETLVVEDLMETWPRTDADVAALEDRVRANPLYENVLISQSGTYTVVSIEPFTYSADAETGAAFEGFDDRDPGADAAPPDYLSDAEGVEMIEALGEVIARYAGPDFEAHIIGGPVQNYHLSAAMARDVPVFLTLSILVEALLLFLLFRRISGVVLPLGVVSAALLSTLGTMAWIDIPMSTTLQILPPFLTVVGICGSIHLLAIVYRQMGRGAPQDEAIPYALGHCGLGVVMASTTTAAGLLSFSVAGMRPIAHLGIIAPIGVMLTMVYSLVMLPALLAIIRLEPVVAGDARSRRGRTDRFLEWSARVSTTHPRRVVGVTAVVFAVFAWGVPRAHFSQDMLRWFSAGHPLRIAEEIVEREFQGALTLEVLIDTGAENGAHDPDALHRIERAMRHVETLRIGEHPVGKAISIVDVVKETHQALNENRAEYYRLPDERPLISQELLLFEIGSDDLEELTDSRFRTVRMIVRVPLVDFMLYPGLVDQVRRDLSGILGDGLPFELTGRALLISEVFDNLIISLARSYVVALAVITPLLVLLVGNLRRGVVAMIPNLIPVCMVLGVMGWLDIPLDITTLLIGGIVIGLAVDDTIHFMNKFNQHYAASGSPADAVRATLTTTGTALLFTSLVLTLGFAVFLFSSMNNLVWFGFLVSFASAVAFLADVLLSPALMMLITPDRSAGSLEPGSSSDTARRAIRIAASR